MDLLNTTHAGSARAREALSGVMDPEIGLNVWDLGLIYAVHLDEDARSLQVKMTLSTPFCPAGDAITHAVERALEQAFPGCSVQVELCFDPPWHPDRISAAGKAFLNR